MRTLADAPFLNFLDPAVQADLERTWADLRGRAAVARTALGVTVLRSEDVHRLLADPRLVTSIPGLMRIFGGDASGLEQMLAASVLAADGADHTRLRRLVSRSFTPRAADRHRPQMHTLVEHLTDGLVARGRCDFVADFADRYPVQVICEVLGVPRDDYHRFARWGNALTHVFSLELGQHLDEVAQAARSLAMYVDALVDDRRRRPRDDLVTSLVQASEDGDRLGTHELQAMIGGLLFAGYDTTRNELGCALFLFCHHPDQWTLLGQRPELVPRAVNEVLRLAGAVMGVSRLAAEDIEVDGWLVPAGTFVYLSLASANRDCEVEDALVFDITRDPLPHFTFGGGPHYCLGANLARAELEEALFVLPRRLRSLRLDGEVPWRANTGITGPTALPLAFDTC